MELLVVISIIALLVSILLPSLMRAKILAKMVKAHAELRVVSIALALYREETRQELPPTRMSCNLQQAYELPLELSEGNYLPQKTNEYDIQGPFLPDPFTGETYKYRAPGASIENETTWSDDGASLWVPEGFPDCSSTSGEYYDDPEVSPVRYAIWSDGPDLDSPKFSDSDLPMGRRPVPSWFWMTKASDTGVITHFEDRSGLMYRSP